MKLDAEKLISTVIKSVNSIGLEKAKISLSQDKAGVNVALQFSDAVLAEGNLSGLCVDVGNFVVEGLQPSLPPNEIVDKAVIRVEKLQVRMSSDIINVVLSSEAFVREINRSSPVEISGLRLVFSGERLSIRGEVRKIFTFPFTIDLYLETVKNCLRIVFENFWAADMLPLPGWVRRAILSIAKQKIEGRADIRELVSITDDYITINPWPKVPLHLDAEFKKFGIQGHQFVCEMGRRSGFDEELLRQRQEQKTVEMPVGTPKPDPSQPKPAVAPPKSASAQVKSAASAKVATADDEHLKRFQAEAEEAEKKAASALQEAEVAKSQVSAAQAKAKGLAATTKESPPMVTQTTSAPQPAAQALEVASTVESSDTEVEVPLTPYFF